MSGKNMLRITITLVLTLFVIVRTDARNHRVPLAAHYNIPCQDGYVSMSDPTDQDGTTALQEAKALSHRKENWHMDSDDDRCGITGEGAGFFQHAFGGRLWSAFHHRVADIDSDYLRLFRPSRFSCCTNLLYTQSRIQC